METDGRVNSGKCGEGLLYIHKDPSHSSNLQPKRKPPVFVGGLTCLIWWYNGIQIIYTLFERKRLDCMIKLIATDMDGTLLDEQRGGFSSTKGFWTTWIKRDSLFVIGWREMKSIACASSWVFLSSGWPGQPTELWLRWQMTLGKFWDRELQGGSCFFKGRVISWLCQQLPVALLLKARSLQKLRNSCSRKWFSLGQGIVSCPELTADLFDQVLKMSLLLAWSSRSSREVQQAEISSWRFHALAAWDLYKQAFTRLGLTRDVAWCQPGHGLGG